MKKKILIIRNNPLKFFFHCLPAIAAIRKHHKDDAICIITDKSLAKFCNATGFFDKVWVDPMSDWLDVGGWYNTIKKIRKTEFDMVYDLQNDKRSEWYFKLMGFKKPNWNSSIVSWCSHSNANFESDEVLSYKDLIHKQLEVAGVKEFPSVNISAFAKDSILKELPEKYIMICPAGDKDNLAHKWDSMKYAEIIEYFENNFGIKSLLIGGEGADYWINETVRKDSVHAGPINFAGNTSIRTLIAVANNAEFCLGNDTAPTHIAAFAGCKTIMLCSRYSPTDFMAPQVKNLAVIEEPYLENVDVERVMNAIEKFCLTKPKSKEFKVMEE